MDSNVAGILLIQILQPPQIKAFRWWGTMQGWIGGRQIESEGARSEMESAKADKEGESRREVAGLPRQWLITDRTMHRWKEK